MKAIRRAVLVVLTATSLAWGAADSSQEEWFIRIRAIAESGRYEHALRAVDLHLLAKPDDPALLAFRVQLLEGLARNHGTPSPLPAAAARPALIPRRLAEPGQDFTTETLEIAMLWVTPGTFLLRDPQGSDNDTLATFSRGYWLGRTEVTQEQWDALMENLPSPSFFKGSDRPVERVSWLSAMEFCRKLTERERSAGRLPAGYEYTLPTEAQWEYACRAGTSTPHAGNLPAMGWIAATSGGQSHPVAQKAPNAWGFHDMHGNVSEWCLDGYGGYPGGHVTDPMINYDGPSAGMVRIVRGGGWNSPAGLARSAWRFRAILSFASPNCGFRVALAPVRNPAPNSALKATP